MADDEIRQRRCEIYAWLCPLSGTPAYVGKTSAGIAARMASHRHTALRKARTPAHLWLRLHLLDGREVEARKLEECTVGESSRVERKWIALLEKDQVLLNSRVGGHGNPGVGRIEWTEERLAALGTVSDVALAQRIGCDRATVTYRRRVLNIPRCKQEYFLRIGLAEHIVGRLGLLPDYVLAKEAGVSKAVIRDRRREAKIPSYATLTGEDGRIKCYAPHRRWKSLPPEVIALLGKVPDYVVGQMVGLTSVQIGNRRRKLGIGAKKAKKWERAAAEGRPKKRRSDFGKRRASKGAHPGQTQLPLPTIQI